MARARRFDAVNRPSAITTGYRSSSRTLSMIACVLMLARSWSIFRTTGSTARSCEAGQSHELDHAECDYEAVTAGLTGWVGPTPACVRSTALAISSRSSGARVKLPAAIHPSTCSGDRAPTIAPLTPGQLKVQAIATAETETPCRDAIGRRASRSDRLRLTNGSLNSGLRRRQSTDSMGSTRSRLKLSVRMPDCIGL